MAEFTLAGGITVDLATGKDVADTADRLYDRLTGNRKRAIFRTLSEVWQLPAATYSNGAEGVANLGSPADGKLWFVRSACQFAVNNSTAIPTWNIVDPPACHLCIGSSPAQLANNTLTDRPSYKDVVVPFLKEVDVSGAGTDDPSFSQPFVVQSQQDLFAYFVAPASLTIASATFFVVNATIMEVDATDVLVGGI